MFWRCPLTSIMCIHSSIHWHLLWVLYGISIAFQCFFLWTFHGLSVICHGCSVYFAWLFCRVTMSGFTDPFNPFPMSNGSSLFYSLLYRDLYNISHAFHSIDINTRFTLLFLRLFSLLLIFPLPLQHKRHTDTVYKQWWCARAVYRYTKIILKCWSYKCTSAKGICGFAWTWGSMDIAWLCSTHGVPFHLCPMVGHGNTMELYGNPMVFHGAQGHTHGVPWKIYGVWWKALGVPWKTQGTPWSIFVRVNAD